jgi:hypothetical protein
VWKRSEGKEEFEKKKEEEAKHQVCRNGHGRVQKGRLGREQTPELQKGEQAASTGSCQPIARPPSFPLRIFHRAHK